MLQEHRAVLGRGDITSLFSERLKVLSSLLLVSLMVLCEGRHLRLHVLALGVDDCLLDDNDEMSIFLLCCYELRHKHVLLAALYTII